MGKEEIMFHLGQVEFEILNSHVKISSGHVDTLVHKRELGAGLETQIWGPLAYKQHSKPQD